MAHKRKRIFDGLYAQLEETDGNVVLFSARGEPSVIFEITNPVQQLCTDAQQYMLFHDVLSNILQTIGEGYALQKQDILCRQAYHHHYFRHDLLIYGYDSQEKTYLTAGFNENMEFCTQAYAYKEVEYAYYTMKNEWDFEFFAFAWNRQYNTELNLKKIITDLSLYIEGENPNRTALEQFLETGYDSYFIQNSYKEYYGIRLYDYITDRLKGQHKLFRKENSNEVIGVNDLRTINALRAHIHIISELVEYVVSGEKKEELISQLKKQDQTLYGIKLLLLRYVEAPERKTRKKLLDMLGKAREGEAELLKEVIMTIENY